MRKIFILVTLAVFSFNLNAQPQTKSQKVNLLILTQKYSEALQLSNELILNYPDSSYYHYQNALVNKLMYHYPQALKSIQNALSLDSNNVDYLTEYAILLDKRDKEKEAADIFMDILNKDTDHIYSGIWLSNYYMKNKNYLHAKDILTKLYNKDSTNAYFARSLGLCSIKLIDKVNSIKWLNRAIQLDSTDIKSYEYIALVYVSLEKFDLALQNLNKAVQFEPYNKELYIKIGDTHVMRNHHFQAIPVFLKAYVIDPNDEFLAKSIGMSFYKVKKYNKAKEYLSIAYKSGLVDVQVCQYLGDIYAENNQLDSSNYYYNEALKVLKPDNSSIFIIKESLGKNCLKMNDYEAAIKVFNEALVLDLSDDFWISYKKNKVIIDIASIYEEKLNDKHKAIEYYKMINEPEIIINKDYYKYAQNKITKLTEELFFEGELK